MTDVNLAGTVYMGAKRLVRLTEAIAWLEDRKEQIVDIGMATQDGTTGVTVCPVSRTKLLELLRAEEAFVGHQLARMTQGAYA